MCVCVCVCVCVCQSSTCDTRHTNAGAHQTVAVLPRICPRSAKISHHANVHAACLGVCFLPGPVIRHVGVGVGVYGCVQARGLYCVYMPATPQTPPRCLIVVVQSAATANREVTAGYVDRTWRAAYTAHCEEQVRHTHTHTHTHTAPAQDTGQPTHVCREREIVIRAASHEHVCVCVVGLARASEP